MNTEDVHLVQAPELSYRFHTKYPLGKNGPLEQITGNNVLRRLRDMARDLDFYKHTNFCSEVETIRMEDGRWDQPLGCRVARQFIVLQNDSFRKPYRKSFCLFARQSNTYCSPAAQSPAAPPKLRDVRLQDKVLIMCCEHL